MHLIEWIDDGLYADHADSTEHHFRQLAEFRVNPFFSVRFQEIATDLLAQARELAAVSRRYGYPCRLESRHVGAELEILTNSDRRRKAAITGSRTASSVKA